jgi:hypothetical protein
MNWVIATIAVYLMPPVVVLSFTLTMAVQKQTLKMARALGRGKGGRREGTWTGRAPNTS